jgi:hypothetical protein
MADLQISAWQTKVRQVRWRQIAQSFLRQLPSWLTGAIGIAAALYVIRPWLPADAAAWLDQCWWTPLAVLAPAAAVAALARSILQHPSPVSSALALDSAFGLQERVTTVVSLKADQRASSAGQALLQDAAQHMDKVDVRSRFPLRLHREAACVPAALGVFLLLVWFYQPVGQSTVQAQSEERAVQTEKPPPEETKEVKKHNEERKKRLKELKSEKFDQLVADLEKLTEKIEKAESKPELQQPAVQDMTKLAENLKKRHDDLGKAQDVLQALRQDQELKKGEDGPGKTLQDALSKGDMKQAMEELSKLAQELKDGSLSEAEKKALAKQLADLKQKLKNIAEQKQRRDAIAKSDADPETKAKELEKLEREAANLEALAKLAEQLSDDALKELAEGDPTQAMKQLKGAMAKLEEMEKMSDEMAELADMMADLEQLKQCLG